jgi:hypothetical protein
MPAGVQAQSPLHPVGRFPVARNPLTIKRAVEASKPFTVAGDYGAIFGEQSGTFEAWVYPARLLS